MPRGDGTGPAGMGPMTGRAAGYCAGYGVPGFMNPAPGRGAPVWGARAYPYGAPVGYGPGFYARGPGFGAPSGRGRAWFGGRGRGFGRGRGWRF
jgi:hypothetical protein